MFKNNIFSRRYDDACHNLQTKLWDWACVRDGDCTINVTGTEWIVYVMWDVRPGSQQDKEFRSKYLLDALKAAKNELGVA
jgi:hypothetical protein